MMRHLISIWILGTFALPFFLGCQPAREPASSSATPDGPETTGTATMKLVVMTEIYDSNGEHQDQQIEMLDAAREVLIQRFNALHWNHPTNRYGIALSAGEVNSTDRKKLSITEELPEGTTQTILAARLEETPPDASSEQYFTFQPIESPDVALKLLLSFLAQDGEYRTMIDWQQL